MADGFASSYCNFSENVTNLATTIVLKFKWPQKDISSSEIFWYSSSSSLLFWPDKIYLCDRGSLPPFSINDASLQNQVQVQVWAMWVFPHTFEARKGGGISDYAISYAMLCYAMADWWRFLLGVKPIPKVPSIPFHGGGGRERGKNQTYGLPEAKIQSNSVFWGKKPFPIGQTFLLLNQDHQRGGRRSTIG